MQLNVNQTKDTVYYSCSSPIISSKAYIGHNVEIGPYSIIGDDVYIGDNTKLGPNVYIPRDTVIGKNNRIYYGAVVGVDPQDLKYEGEPSQLIIGDNNIIREYVTISRGTKGGGYITRIGNHNLLMGNVHIAHDVKLGNHNIISHYTGLAGHVETDDYVTIGGNSGILQFCKLGAYCMIGAFSYITKDVLPYSLSQGNPAKYFGINVLGLRRRNFNSRQRILIQRAFKILHDAALTSQEIHIKLENLFEFNQENQDIITNLMNFLKNSTRGFYKKTEISV